ncbi:hypothetical protein niasHS_017418 [Heterodera schachtii]|uniref:PHD-type domain-containing protein n=1 Tax=Heterodera schachtii TaxID=97005 RepID=A0ABD2HXG1_HETSC
METNFVAFNNNITDQSNEDNDDKADNHAKQSKEMLKESQSEAETSSKEEPKNELEETEKEERKQKSVGSECEQQKAMSDSSEESGREHFPLVEQLDCSPLYRDPTFAELCSFFNMFTPMFGFKPISFSKLENMFCTLVEGDATRELIDLHITLMRKIYLKSARADKWEQSLLKFCAIAPGLDAEFRQLQRNTYGNIPMGSKLAVMKALCDSQFDYNLKFKENIANSFRHNELRLAPIGTDKRGQMYYFQVDYDLEFRVYSEETDDMAGVSWSLRARTEAELAELIETLRNPDYGLVTKEQQEEEEADIDEEQLLDQPNEARKDATQTRPSSASSASKPFQPNLSDEERQKVQLEGTFSVLWDHYKKAEILNKRKNEKEKKRGQSAEISSTNATQQKQKEEQRESNGNEENGETEEKGAKCDGEENEKSAEEKQQNDEEKEAQAEREGAEKSQELDEALLAEIEAEEQRRVLPRRSARNAALQNIKAFGGSPRRQFISEVSGGKAGDPSSPIGLKKTGFVPATAGSCTEESEDESEEEEGETGDDSSDDDFLLDGEEKPKRKVGRPPTKRAKGGKAKGKKRTTGGKGAKKAETRRLRLIGRPATSHDYRLKMKKHQQSVVLFEDGETSEDEETTELKERRERKMATELTLCQICKGSKSPDLLLLCDSCDTAWHTFCLRPQLWFVPDGDWFCPFCEHSALIRRLIYALIKLREEKKVSEDERKKKEAADRMKREMDYIGISLNNIIPLALQKDGNGQSAEWSDSSQSEEEDNGGGEGERKSKKKAMKMVMSRTREKRRAEHFYGPIVTIAEGRSRRALTKVDYNFHAYDEQLQEAMETNGPDVKVENAHEEATSARGKDMQNIYEAEKKQKREEEPSEGGREEGAPARPPNSGEGGRTTKKGGRKGKRLTDLDIGNASESDTDEWKASSADENEEDPEPSEDEYLPSERRSARGIGFQGRRRSDDEFINDDSDSDYTPSAKKKGIVGKRIGRAKKRKRQMSSSSDDENELQLSDTDCEAGPSSRKKSKASKSQTHHRKWGPKASSSEEEDDEDEETLVEREVERTETGRPLRKAAVNMRKKLKEELQYEEEEDEEEGEETEQRDEEEEGTAAGEQIGRLADRAVSALARPQRTVGNRQAKTPSQNQRSASEYYPPKRSEEGDADEFKPDEDDEAEADEEEEEAEKEEEVEESDEEGEEEKEGESETSTDKGEEEEKDGDVEGGDSTKGGATPTGEKESKTNRKAVSKKGLSRNKTQPKKSDVSPKQTKPKTEEKDQNSSLSDKVTLSDTDNEHQTPVQRQTRQQLKKQMPEQTQKNAESSIIDFPSTSNNSDVAEEAKIVSHPKAINDIIETTDELKQKQAKNEEAAPSSPITTTSKITANSVTVTANSKALQNALPTNSTGRTATVFQQIHPQQLSQYFMRPTVSNSQRQQQQQHQTQTLSAPIPTVPESRFRAEAPTPSVSYSAYGVTHQPLRVGHVPPPPSLLTAHQFPISGAIPFAVAHPHSQQAAAYFVQQNRAPQIIYQTLQPISSVSSQLSTQQQADHDGSLSHALAGAMNPEDL